MTISVQVQHVRDCPNCKAKLIPDRNLIGKFSCSGCGREYINTKQFYEPILAEQIENLLHPGLPINPMAGITKHRIINEDGQTRYCSLDEKPIQGKAVLVGFGGGQRQKFLCPKCARKNGLKVPKEGKGVPA